MTALTAIRVLLPLAMLLSPLALQAAPGHKTMRVYSARMETLFIRLDVNRDGRLDASEVQGRRGLSRRLKRQNNRSYLLLEDFRPQGPWATPQAPSSQPTATSIGAWIDRKPNASRGSVAISMRWMLIEMEP